MKDQYGSTEFDDLLVPAEFPLVPAPDVLAAALRYDKGTPNEGRIRAKMPSECRMADALRDLREECAAIAEEFIVQDEEA